MSDDQYDPYLVAFVQQLFAEQYIDIAMLCLLAYEYLATFQREVALIWKRKFTFASGLFVANRYLALIYGANLVQVDNVHTRLGCIVGVRVFQALVSLLTIIFALFSGLRIYALWDRNLYLCILIIALNLVPIGTNLYLYTQQELLASNLGVTIACLSQNPIPTHISLRLSNTTRISVIIAELLVFVLTGIKTIGIKREASQLNMKVDLTTLLIKDGSIYFFIMFAMNLVQIVLVRVTDVSGYVSPSLISVLTPILISRFMLDLRDLNRVENDTSIGALSNFSFPNFALPDIQDLMNDEDDAYPLEELSSPSEGPQTPIEKVVGNMDEISAAPSETRRDSLV